MPRTSNNRRPEKVGLFLLVLGWAALIPACQQGPSFDFAEVEGAITKDGQPLDGVAVYFKPDGETRGPQSMGVTDEAGRYHLRTYKGDAGAAIGRHRICLLDVKEKYSSSARSRIPSKYGNAAKTPLSDVEVKPSKQVLDFDVGTGRVSTP